MSRLLRHLGAALLALALLSVSGCVQTPPVPDVFADTSASDGRPDAEAPMLEDWLPGLWLVGWLPDKLNWYRFGPIDPTSGKGLVEIAILQDELLNYFSCVGSGTWRVTSANSVLLEDITSPCPLNLSLEFYPTTPASKVQGAVESVLVASAGRGLGMSGHRFEDSHCPDFPDCPDPK